MAAFAKAGVVKALVSTLSNDSPFRVAAVAGALGSLAQIEGNHTALEASGAVPALVKLIRERRVTAVSPSELQKELPVFQRCGGVYDNHNAAGKDMCVGFFVC